MKRILLTGGRGPATLDLARHFSRLGHEVYVAEAQRIHFCTFSNAVKKSFVVPSPLVDEAGFVRTLNNIITAHKIDYLIPTYDEVYFIAKYKAELSKCTTVFCDDIETIDKLNNKQKFIAWMESLGLNVPQTCVIQTREEYLDRLQQGNIPYPHILKPIYTGGGVEVLKIETIADAIQADASFPSLVQEFIEGEGFCTFGIAHKGQLSCHAIYKPLYIFRQNGAAVCFKAIEDTAILAFASTIVAAAQFSGMLGFDLIRKKDGTLWAIECNPRITNGIHLVEACDHIDDHFFGLQSFKTICPEQARQVSRVAMLRILGLTVKGDYATWFHYFVNSKEVIFERDDPIPTLALPLIGVHFFLQYYRYHKTPEQAIFYNVDWSIEGDAKSASQAHIPTHPMSSLFCKPSARQA
ncbi:MAG: ATP-grasp domain-containing protein [Gammaproteobacteria bacterium]